MAPSERPAFAAHQSDIRDGFAIMSPARIPGQLTSSFSSGSAGTALPLARSQIVWQCDRLATTTPVGVTRSPPSRHICCGHPLVTTGCGYLPTGYLPTGYLPIGALPTGGAGGGGSLRGRSAAAAALSMAKDAAVASTTIFIMTIPLVSGQHRLSEARRRDNRRGTPPSSHHHLARAVSTAARLTML